LWLSCEGHEISDDVEASTGDWRSGKSAATRSLVQNGVQRRHGLQRRFRRFRDRVTAVQLFAPGRRPRRRHHLKGHNRCRLLGHDGRKQLSWDISSRRDKCYYCIGIFIRYDLYFLYVNYKSLVDNIVCFFSRNWLFDEMRRVHARLIQYITINYTLYNY